MLEFTSLLTTTTQQLRHTEQSVVELITSLYQNAQTASEASRKLTLYQTSSESWSISVSLLLYAAPIIPPEESLQLFRKCTPGLSRFSMAHATIVQPDVRDVVSFFSAQTLCTLCQAGFESVCQLHSHPGESQEEIFDRIRIVLTELIWCYRAAGSSPTVRQLTQAVSACTIFTLSFIADLAENAANVANGIAMDSSTTDEIAQKEVMQKRLQEAEPVANQMTNQILERYGRSPELFPALLEVLASLPQDIQSKKIAITTQQRSMVSYLILSQTQHVWNAIAKIFDTISSVPTIDARPKDCETLYSLAASTQLATPFTSTITLRKLVLQSFQTWLEAHCRYHRCSEFSQNTALPPLSNEIQLLRQTPIIPIILLNFEVGVQQSLGGGPVASAVHRDYQPNDHLEADFNAEDSLGWQVVSAASDSLVEALEFFYSNSLHITSSLDSEALAHDALPLINSSNIESLFAIFQSIARINDWLRQMTKSSGSQRIPATGIADGVATIDVNIIPRAVLRGVTNVIAKFAEVFLPALTFCMQFEGIDIEELQNANVNYPDANKRAELISDLEKLYDMMIEFLSHPSLEFRHHVLDFWFSLIGNQFTQQQAQLETATTEIMALKAQSALPNDIEPIDNTPSIIIPAFDFLVSALMRLSMFPSRVIGSSMEFSFEAWVKYRDEVGMNLTDVTAILGCTQIIEKAGGDLLQILQTYQEQPAFQVPWPHIEVCLFILTTVAPRAPAGDDDYIPKALESLPTLPYPAKGTVAAVILNCASARFILWTAGYIGTQRELFGKCFQLLSAFIPDLLLLTSGLPEVSNKVITQPELHTFLTYCERVMVEALNASVTAAATMLARNTNVPETDVTFVLNGLAELAMMSKLSLESRASLIVSAGAVLQCLPKDKMQKYHYKLGQALYNKAVESLPDASITSNVPLSSIESLKLFFVALESVKPIDPVPLPPPSPNAVPLERSSEHRHPVLNVMEEFWPLFEKCLLEFHSSETIVEYVCHCVVRVFSQTQHHAIRYTLFYSFLDCLAKSFIRSPSVFHLGALRSMLGIFGMNNEDPVQRSLNASLIQCTECVLNAMKESGAQTFVSLSPDIVGMTLDCTNTALNSAVETAGLLSMESFQHCLNLSIQLTPECHHPKVLMTMMLLMTRFVAWIEPLRTDLTAALGMKGRQSDKWTVAAKRSSELAVQLTNEMELINKIIHSVVRATTEIFQGNAQWIGIVGSLLSELFSTQHWAEPTRRAFRNSLEMAPRNIVPFSLIDDVMATLSKDELAKNHRVVCTTLQKLADQSEANWHKSQYTSHHNTN